MILPVSDEVESRGYFPIARAPDDELRARLPPAIRASALLVWHSLCRLGNDNRGPEFRARIGLIAALAAVSKRICQDRLRDLARLGFVEVTPSQTHAGSLYRLRRGTLAEPETLPASKKDPAPSDSLAILKASGRFPRLTAEALTRVEREYPGIVLARHVKELAERASASPREIGDPLAWLRARFDEIKEVDPASEIHPNQYWHPSQD